MNEKVLGVLSGVREGLPLVVTTPTRCSAPATGEVYLGLVSGTRDGKPLVAFSTQRCDGATENLAVDRGYLGLLSGTRDGKPLLVVPCGPCEDDPGEPFAGCDCTVCCTLDGTLELGDGSTGYEAGIDFTMYCGRTFTTAAYVSCLNNEIEDDTYCYKVTTTWSGGSGADVPYDFITATGVYDWTTEVWVSDEFDIDGETYRVYLVMTKYIVTQITPTSEDPVEFCAYQWGVQRLYTVPPLDDTCCGTNWGTVYSYGTTGGGFAAVNLNSSVSPDNENPCIDGYYENGNGGCGAPAWCESPPVGYNAAVGIGNDPLVECSPESPFLITHAVMYCPFPAGACPGDPSTAIKCFRITIADNCDPP